MYVNKTVSVIFIVYNVYFTWKKIVSCCIDNVKKCIDVIQRNFTLLYCLLQIFTTTYRYILFLVNGLYNHTHSASNTLSLSLLS